jgi:hypothetical protein
LSRGPAKIFRGAAITSRVTSFTFGQHYNVWMLHSNFNSQTLDCLDGIFFVMPGSSRKIDALCQSL